MLAGFSVTVLMVAFLALPVFWSVTLMELVARSLTLWLAPRPRTSFWTCSPSLVSASSGATSKRRLLRAAMRRPPEDLRVELPCQRDIQDTWMASATCIGYLAVYVERRRFPVASWTSSAKPSTWILLSKGWDPDSTLMNWPGGGTMLTAAISNVNSSPGENGSTDMPTSVKFTTTSPPPCRTWLSGGQSMAWLSLPLGCRTSKVATQGHVGLLGL